MGSMRKERNMVSGADGKGIKGTRDSLGAVIDLWNGGECRARFHIVWCRSIAYVGNDLVLFLFLDAIGK
jgi:hypothetical protein